MIGVGFRALWDPKSSTGGVGGGYFWVTRESIEAQFFCLGIAAKFTRNVEGWDLQLQLPTQSVYF